METQTLHETERRASNRRTERRFRCFRAARVIFNSGFTVYDCVVRNISRSGAMLEMETLLGVPKRFELALEYGSPARPVEVRWRTDQRMGIAFDDMRLPQAA